MGDQYQQVASKEQRNALGAVDINGNVKKNQFGAVIQVPDALYSGQIAGQKTKKQIEKED